MNRLVFPSNVASAFRSEMLKSDLETAGIVLALPVPQPEGGWRLLVQEAIVAPEWAYEERTQTSAQLRPTFLAAVFKQARTRELSVVLSHTHPNEDPISPSATDVAGERQLLPSLYSRVPDGPHGRLILGHGDYNCAIGDRRALLDQAVKCWSVGPNVSEFPSSTREPVSEAFDRQIRMFGEKGQTVLARLRVGVVGLGGTGSIVAQQLAHLGIRDFVLCDPDTLEESNLSRIVSSSSIHVGELKAHVAKRSILSIRPEARVEVLTDSVLQNRIAKQLVGCDVFFCCTDSHGSRAVLNQLSAQYLLPMYDVGVRIDTKSGRLERVSGRAQMIAPGLACLACGNLLDSEEVRRDLMSDFERRQDPYIPGHVVHQPSVITINGIVCSLVTTMFLASALSLPLKARYQLYSGESGRVRVVESEPQPGCIVCSAEGVAGLGNTRELWGRP